MFVDKHDVQSSMFRPTITDMQGKHCGDCYDIYLILNHYTKVVAFGRHLRILALDRVNIKAVTTILVLHVGNGRSERV